MTCLWSRAVPSEAAAALGKGVSAQVLRGISRNSAFLVAGQFLSRVVGFVYILILAHYFGVEDFGTFNLVISFVLITMTGIEFGLGRLMVRDLARDAGLIPSYLSTLLPLRAALALAGYLVLLTIIWMVGYSGHMLVLTAIAAVALFPTSLGLVFESLFQARQQMRYSAAGEVVAALVQCSVGTAIIVAGGSLNAVLAAGVVAALAYMAFLARRARACGYPFHPRFDRQLCANLVRQAAPFAVVTLFAILANRAELLILSGMSTAENIGLFSAAARFPETALLLPAVLVSAAAPALSQLHASSREHLRSVYMWILHHVLSVTLPLTLAGVVLAESILGLLFPPDYRRATLVLQLLFCAFPLASVQMINSVVLLMSNRPRLMLFNVAVSTGVQFGLSLILISRFGLFGAAFSALASQVFNSAFSYWCVRTWFVDTTGLGRLLAPLAAAGVVSVALTAILIDAWGVWSLGPAVCAYAVVLVLLNRFWPARQMPATAGMDSR